MKFLIAILILVLLTYPSAVSGQVIRRVKVTELEKVIAEHPGPLVINIWATWCTPCIEEIPYFLEAYRKHKAAGDSLELLLVSLDFKEAYPETIRSFTRKRKYDVPILWLDETNADYFCPKIDPKWSGVIPATLFINNKKGYRNFLEEQISRDQLEKELMAILE